MVYGTFKTSKHSVFQKPNTVIYSGHLKKYLEVFRNISQVRTHEIFSQFIWKQSYLFTILFEKENKLTLERKIQPFRKTVYSESLSYVIPLVIPNKS